METDIYQLLRERLLSDDTALISSALWVLEPKQGQFRVTGTLDADELRFVPIVQKLLRDRRLCCLTAVVTGRGERYYGEVRLYAALVLAEFNERMQVNMPLILRNVVRPFTSGQARQIAEQHQIADVWKVSFDLLHEKGLLQTIPEVDLSGQALGWMLQLAECSEMKM
jgi:hypothetical protein